MLNGECSGGSFGSAWIEEEVGVGVSVVVGGLG